MLYEVCGEYLITTELLLKYYRALLQLQPVLIAERIVQGPKRSSDSVAYGSTVVTQGIFDFELFYKHRTKYNKQPINPAY